MSAFLIHFHIDNANMYVQQVCSTCSPRCHLANMKHNQQSAVWADWNLTFLQVFGDEHFCWMDFNEKSEDHKSPWDSSSGDHELPNNISWHHVHVGVIQSRLKCWQTGRHKKSY